MSGRPRLGTLIHESTTRRYAWPATAAVSPPRARRRRQHDSRSCLAGRVLASLWQGNALSRLDGLLRALGEPRSCGTSASAGRTGNGLTAQPRRPSIPPPIPTPHPTPQGVCGYTDRFCGQYCMSGACKGGGSSPPPAGGGGSPDVDPSMFTGA